LQEIGESLGRPFIGLTKDAKAALLRHDWPGNARELRNVLERAAILCEGGPVAADHLALHAKPVEVPRKPTTDLSTVEREMIRHVMRVTGWNKSRAARRLGLSRTQLYLRLRKYALENGVTPDDDTDRRDA
jgi:two-component system response regulator HydG